MAIHTRLDDMAGRKGESLEGVQREQLEPPGRIEQAGRVVHRETTRTVGPSLLPLPQNAMGRPANNDTDED